MSDETKVTEGVVENTTETTNQEYRIEVASHETFNYLTKTSYIDSVSLCKKVSDLFKAAYADCYGSTFDVVPGQNAFMISLYFDHDNHGDDVVAVSRDATTSNERNSTLKRTRSFARRLAEGDRFHITQDGISGLTPFMMEAMMLDSSIRRTINSMELLMLLTGMTTELYLRQLIQLMDMAMHLSSLQRSLISTLVRS